MAETVKLSGFRELHDALGEFEKRIETNLLRRVAKKALEPMQEMAKQLAPVDDGQLRDSIVLQSGNLTKSARAQDKAEPKRGVRVYVGTANRNAVPREFGTWRTRIHPFMRPAWDATSGKMLDSVKDDLATEIERTRKRVKKGK